MQELHAHGEVDDLERRDADLDGGVLVVGEPGVRLRGVGEELGHGMRLARAAPRSVLVHDRVAAVRQFSLEVRVCFVDVALGVPHHHPLLLVKRPLFAEVRDAFALFQVQLKN